MKSTSWPHFKIGLLLKDVTPNNIAYDIFYGSSIVAGIVVQVTEAEPTTEDDLDEYDSSMDDDGSDVMEYDYANDETDREEQTHDG